MSNNRVTLFGKVLTPPVYSHQVYGEGFYETVLDVQRLSEQSDKLPITVSERLIADHNIAVGSEISVSGQLRSYNKVVDEKSKLLLTVFVREILEEEEYKNPNSIELAGYICKPPVYRTTPFKREICDLLLAVNRAYNKSDYIPCIAWGRNARFVRNIAIGERVELSGRVQSREYQKVKENGETEIRTAYEVSINRINTETVD